MVKRLVLVCLAMFAVFASRVRADDVEAQKEARVLFEDELQHFNNGEYVDALAKFQASYGRFARAGTILNIATTLHQLGRDDEAADAYDRYLADPQKDPNKLDDVQKALKALEGNLGRIGLTVEPGDATVTIDGKELPAPRPDVLRVLAGRHLLLAQKDGFTPLSQPITVGPGPTVAVVLRLSPVVHDVPVVVRPRVSMRLGAFARADLDPLGPGGVVAVGIDYLFGKRLDVGAAGLIGPVGGVYVGARIALMTTKIRPMIAVGVPLVFLDGPRVGIHAAAGVEWAASPFLHFFVDVGAQVFPSPPMDRLPLVFLPSLGVYAKL